MAPKAAASSGRRTVTRDWNLVWASKNLADLADIPVNNYGFCGCSICGPRMSVKGSTFAEHMRNLHGQRTTYKRARTTSHSHQGSMPPPSLPTRSSFDQHPLDIDNHDNAGPSTYDRPSSPSYPVQVTPNIVMEPATEVEPLDELPPDTFEEEGPMTEETVLQALEALFQHSTTDEGDLPIIRPLTPKPLEEFAPPSPPGAFHGRSIPADDLLAEFPIDIPMWMKEPTFSGARPNPHSSFPSDTLSVPLFQRALPLLAHALTGLYGIARRPINLALQVASIIVRNAENRMYERFRRWYIAHHPDASEGILAELEDDLNPAFESPAAPSTLETALRRIGVNSTLVVHPVCPNRECFNVFYHITAREQFSTLPANCPACSTSLFAKGQPIARHFARRTLKDELEVIFAVRGVEEALDRRDQRKQARDEEDHKGGGTWGKIYRQQDDGSEWKREGGVRGLQQDSDLSLTVNLSIDWANASSTRSAATDSIGPIVLQLADLPPQLRSSFACVMIVGVTPGPKAPRPANLYKFMLPLVMELRDSEPNGIWLQTPRYPQGRLVYIRLGALVCDRPAAVELTGGPFYSAHATPCLRCEIHASEILDLSKRDHPLRSSDAHNRAIFKQVADLPAFLLHHKEAHRLEQQRSVEAGLIPRAKAYLKDDLNKAIAQNNRFAGHISALAAIPSYDKFGMAVFDPMHTLLEGLVKTYFHKVLISGKHGSAGDDAGGVAGVGRQDAREAGEATGDSEGESNAETEWDSEGEANQAGAIAERILGGFETGTVVIPTSAEIQTLRKGVKKIGKKAPKPRTKRLGESGTRRLQDLLSDVSAPSSIPCLHPEFGSPAAGTPTASHWKAYATVYGPLTLPLLFHERGVMSNVDSRGNKHLTTSELKAMMLMFELVSVAVRTTISDTLLARLSYLIDTFLSLSFSLHPTLAKSTNFHVVTHLVEDIKRFGPAPGWWTFPAERVNYVIKNVNMSGANKYQASVVGLRAVVKAKQMVSARINALDAPVDASKEDKDLVDELADTFAAFHQEEAANVLEQVALRFAEVDRLSLSDTNELSSRSMLVRPRGSSQERTLDDTTLALLQECLRKNGQTTRSVLDIEEGDLNLPYLPSRATFWEGVVFGNRRLDAAEWGKPLKLKVDPADVRDLLRRRNGLFESRREEVVFGGQDTASVTGVICAIFEHTASGLGGGKLPPRLFGIVRKLKRYTGHDPYGYRQHHSLGVWLWECDTLDDPVILWLNPKTLESLRPLAICPLPQDPRSRNGPLVWATIPVSYH